MPTYNDGGSNAYTFEAIANMLKDYKNLKRKVLQLEFEIARCSSMTTDEDIIDAMTFGRANEAHEVHSGKVSDKTANIAISYTDKVYRSNLKIKQELEIELYTTMVEIERIGYYISILDEKQAKTLNMLYLEEKTFVDAATELDVAVSTIRNLRRAGIQRLVTMFNGIVR